MPTLLAPIAAVLLTLGGGGGGGDATVVSVGDGDSLRLRRGKAVIAVRLACIDAPELRQRPHGQVSRRVLRELAPVGSTVQLRRFSTDPSGSGIPDRTSLSNRSILPGLPGP